MRAEKRDWLFSGLVAEPGKALVVPRPRRLRARRGRLRPRRARVLLVGARDAQALAPVLGRLVRGSGIELDVLAEPGASLRQWATSRRLSSVIRERRPDLVLLTYPPDPLGLPRGVDVLWLPRLDRWGVGREVLPASMLPGWAPTARGFAVWAAAAWMLVR